MLIAATDGLWDNTYDDEVMQFLPDSPDDLPRVCVPALFKPWSHGPNIRL